MAAQSIPVDQTTVDTSRFECVEGELVERPLPNNIHSDVQFAVTFLLKRMTRPLGLSARQEWTLDETDQPRHNWMTPDTLVASDTSLAPNGHCLPPALLAVEVLSPGQTYGNMSSKVERYFRWGVAHVWMIEPVEKTAVTVSAASPDKENFLTDGRGILSAGDIELSLQEVLTFE